MDTKKLKPILDWAKSTDLEEVSFRKNEESLEFQLEGAVNAPQSVFPPCSLSAITASEVGIFRAEGQGTAVNAEEGCAVSSGQVVGYIETGSNRHPVKSDTTGKIISAKIEDGQPVEFGQPLFFVQPT